MGGYDWKMAFENVGAGLVTATICIVMAWLMHSVMGVEYIPMAIALSGVICAVLSVAQIGILFIMCTLTFMKWVRTRNIKKVER